MIAAWISPLSATAVMASSTLDTTRSSNCTSSDGVAQRPQALRQAFGSRGRGIVGEQDGVELLLLSPRHKLLVGQRCRRVEQCGAVAVLGEQAHRQRHLVGEPLRREIGEVAAERLQIRRARDTANTARRRPRRSSSRFTRATFVRGVQPRALRPWRGDGTRRRAGSRYRSACTTGWLPLPARKREASSGARLSLCIMLILSSDGCPLMADDPRACHAGRTRGA